MLICRGKKAKKGTEFFDSKEKSKKKKKEQSKRVE